MNRNSRMAIDPGIQSRRERERESRSPVIGATTRELLPNELGAALKGQVQGHLRCHERARHQP
jgi:hypothetical protein